MATEVLLLNPRRRKRRRRMTAKQRMYFGPRRRRRARVSSRRRRRSNPIAGNPRRRRRHTYSIRRRRRNPTARGIFNQAIDAGTRGFFGALGGLGNDVLYGFVKPNLPIQLQTGLGRSASKILSAVVVGMLANMLPGRLRGKDLAVGAATVVLHEALKEQLVTMAPQLPLGEYDMGYMNPGATIESNVGAYLPGGGGYDEMGAYMNDQVGVGDYAEYE